MISWDMEKRRCSSSCSSIHFSTTGSGSRKRTELFNIIKSAACLNSSSSSSSPDNTGKGRSKLSGNRVTHGFHLVEGKSGHDMEDYHVARYIFDNGVELGLFAIFDGHLGDGVPTYLKDNLFNNILKQPNFWTETEAAMRNAYRSTDQFILENAAKLGPGGSTAVTAIVMDGKDLWIANIGDSRAVVCERGVADQLTVDHEPRVERERIEKQGGFVTAIPGKTFSLSHLALLQQELPTALISRGLISGDVPRVNGQLAVARAFGDQSLKAHLSSEPDVRHVPINPTIEFVILASDGLWKVMENQEAVDLVRPIKDPQAAAKRLTTEALSRKSKDDISCIVTRFRC